MDIRRLSDLAAKRGSTRTQKRLGWLTERAGWEWSDADRALLAADWSPNHRAGLGGDRGQAARRWDDRWRLIIDVPDSELQPELGVR
ncbi:MAG: hypothetical protein ACYDAG_15555 [Chloroflexota bacterium]